MAEIRFLDENGTFELKNPEAVSGLYFPLASETGLKSAIAPDLAGDSKLDQESFLHPRAVYEGRETQPAGAQINGREAMGGIRFHAVALEPGETAVYLVFLGISGDAGEIAKVLAAYGTEERVQAALERTKTYWQSKVNVRYQTGSKDFDRLMRWVSFQPFLRRIYGCSFLPHHDYGRGGRGWRDLWQDCLSLLLMDPGGGLPLVKFTHNPGHEDTPEDASYVRETGHPAYRADDALWLFPTVYKYIAETGNTAFLDEVIPFANRDQGTVYEHLKRALDFSINHLGPHGMPAGLHADWNDCLRLGANGESSFVAFQFYYAFTILRQFAAWEKDEAYLARLEREQEKLRTLLNGLCWDGDRFIRGFTETGEVIGHHSDPEANLWLNPQSWAVISGLADAKQAETAMENVYARLNTEYGAILMDPPYHAHAFDGALAVIYNAGVKENAGVFSQSQGWLILAEALLGHGDRAFAYFRENAPSIPREWKALEINKTFRGKQLHILVENPEGKESGCTSLTVNGKPMEGDYVPESCLTAQTEIVLTL